MVVLNHILFREKLAIQYFRTATGVTVKWLETIADYLDNNSADDPIVAVTVPIAPVAHAIPKEVQESLLVLANYVRSHRG